MDGRGLQGIDPLDGFRSLGKDMEGKRRKDREERGWKAEDQCKHSNRGEGMSSR